MGPLVSSIIDALDEYGFDVVLSESIPTTVMDFSSYFAKAEEAGAQILYPLIYGDVELLFVREYCDRQSPMVIWGSLAIASNSDFWELTGGKCEHITVVGYPVVAGYPLTAKTIPTREAYIERWGEAISSGAAAAYDTVRFILPNAIERAGTIETDAAIEALEETEVETSLARRFVFTSSHDIMVDEAGPNRPTEDYFLVALFQWQDGELIPVYPIEIMKEAGASYTFPEWPGPWDNLD
jgi:branched-chain amino acid transport system substrate-binding protein